MSLKWWQVEDIVTRESNLTRQKAVSVMNKFADQRELQLQQEAQEARERKYASGKQMLQYMKSLQRATAADEIMAANKQLQRLGVDWGNLIPVSESTVKQQIMSGGQWAGTQVKVAELESKQARVDDAISEAKSWAQWQVRKMQADAKERGEAAPAWTDYSPEEQEALINQWASYLLGQRYPNEYGVVANPLTGETPMLAPIGEQTGEPITNITEWYPNAQIPEQGLEIQDGIILKPDYSVVSGNETIGKIDPETGDFIERKKTAGEKILSWFEKVGNILKWFPPNIPANLIEKYGFTAIEKIDLPFMIQDQAYELNKRQKAGTELTEEQENFLELYKSEVGEPPEFNEILAKLHPAATPLLKWAGAELSPSEELKKAYYDSAGVASRMLHGLETPLSVALFVAGGLGGATAAESRLAQVAQKGGTVGKAAQAGQVALAPLAGYEWAIGNLISKTVGGTYRTVMTSVLRRNLRSWAKSVGVEIPKATEDTFIKEALRNLRPSFMTKEALRTLFKPVKGGQTITQAGAAAVEQAAAQAVKTSPLLLGLTKAPTAGAAVATTTAVIPSQVTKSNLPLVKYWLKNGWAVSKPTSIAEMRQLTNMGFEQSPNLQGYFVKRPETPPTEVLSEEPTAETIALAEGETVTGSEWQTTAMAEGSISGEVPENASSPIQQQSMVEAAQGRFLIDEDGVSTSAFNRLAKNVIGKKNIDEMTIEEVALLEDVIVRLPLGRKGRPPRIPSPATIYNAILPMSEEFVKKIPVLRDLGFIDRFRPARKVWGKLDLYHEIYEPTFNTEILFNEARAAFTKELSEISKLVSKNRREAIFDALENPEQAVTLSSDELLARDWFRDFFDDWADKLGLPASKRRSNYVTHIFEADITEQLKQNYLDTELYQALDFLTPKTTFMPYLEKRLGRTAGVVKDPFRAASAYQSRALKKYYYEPLIKRIRIYERYLPPTAARALREYITRLTGRPLEADMAVNNDLKAIANTVAKLPGGKGLANILSSGNAAGMLAYYATGAYYMAWLGARPASAIKNLSQHGLILAEVGPEHLAKGIGLRATAEGKRVLAKSAVLRSRQIGYLPGIDKAFITHWPVNMQEKAMTLFRLADKQNVSDAFLAGYSEAKSRGLPEEWAIKRGDEVAEQTQYVYTKMGGAMWTQTAPGRLLGVMTTWPVNFAELLGQWIKGTPSRVYTDYAKSTGGTPPEAKPVFNKQLITFLLLTGALYAVQKNTKIRSMAYSGAMSLQTMADILSGDLPGLTWIGGIADIISGTATGDTARIKQGWYDINPTRTVAIFKQMMDIANGERDWMSLFLYENYEHIRKSGGDDKQIKNTIRDVMAQSEYIKNWKDLSLPEQAKLIEKYPDLSD